MPEISSAAFGKEYNRLYEACNGLYHDLARHYGLADSTFWVLYYLRDADKPLTQSEICAAMGMSKQTMNTSLKKMEADGLLTLQTAPGNRRSKVLRLTEQGEALAGATVDEVLRMEMQANALLSAKERAMLLALNQRHLQALRQAAAPLLRGE